MRKRVRGLSRPAAVRFMTCCCLVCREAFPMVLVANKVDLVHLRKVTSEQGQEMAAKHSVSAQPPSEPLRKACRGHWDKTRAPVTDKIKQTSANKQTKKNKHSTSRLIFDNCTSNISALCIQKLRGKKPLCNYSPTSVFDEE